MDGYWGLNNLVVPGKATCNCFPRTISRKDYDAMMLAEKVARDKQVAEVGLLEVERRELIEAWPGSIPYYELWNDEANITLCEAVIEELESGDEKRVNKMLYALKHARGRE